MSSNRYEKERERTRLAFLNATLNLILEHGYDVVTVADIAREADYGRSTFYEHFADKEAVTWAILEHHMLTLDEQIGKATLGLYYPHGEWIAWCMIFRDIEKQRPFFLKMDGELSRRLRERQKELLIAGFEMQYRHYPPPFLRDVPADIGARFVIGSALEVLDYWLAHPDIGTADEMAKMLFEMLYRQEPPEDYRYSILLS